MTSIHYSSKTDLWSTPQAFFDKVDSEFKFTLDACASSFNTKCHQFFTKEDDGLSKTWNGTVWMNPPYGRMIGKWLQKAYVQALNGATVVCLVPARTDTRWFHDYCARGEIRFIKGRLKFGGSKNSAPFPSALVIFRPPAIQTTGALL